MKKTFNRLYHYLKSSRILYLPLKSSKLRKLKAFYGKLNANRRRLLPISLGLLLILLPVVIYSLYHSQKASAAPQLILTTGSDNVQIDVKNHYRAILQKSDTDDYLLIYDRAENDGSPDQVFEFLGPWVDETNNYSLRDDDNRITTILESTSNRVVVRVEGKLNNEASTDYLDDEGADNDITVTETYTFTADGFFVNTEIDLQNEGVDLDNGDVDDGYRWMQVEFTGEASSEKFLETVYYGDGTTESSASSDSALSNAQTYVVIQGADSYQDAIVGIGQTGWLDVQDGDTTNDRSWYYDVDNSGSIDRLYTRAQNTQPAGTRNAQWFFLLLDQSELDTEAEREMVINAQRNPDSLTDGLTTGSAYEHYIQTKTFQPGASDGKDTKVRFVDNGADVKNYGIGTGVSAKNQTTPSYDVERSLIEFDASSIPGDASAESATIYLWSATSNNAATHDIREIAVDNADWPEGTKSADDGGAGDSCWDYKDQDPVGQTSWAGSAGLSTVCSTNKSDSSCDYAPDTIGQLSYPGSSANTEVTSSLTASAVETWFGSSNTNYGILITSQDTTSSNYHSSDNSTSDLYFPKTVVDYTHYFSPIQSSYGIDASSDEAMFDIDGGTYTQHNPSFKIRGYRRNEAPKSITLEDEPLENGYGMNISHQPVSNAFFANEITWYSTLEGTTAEIGTDATQDSNDFTTGKYGNGARFDDDGESLYFTLAAGEFNDEQGAIEFWYQPTYDHTELATHHLFNAQYDGNNKVQGYHRSTGALTFVIVVSGSPVLYEISSSNYSWNAYDWVHLRFEWDASEDTSTQQRILVNGIEPATHTDSGTDYAGISDPTTFYIGNDSTTGSSEANGIIDEFHIYNGTAGDMQPVQIASGGHGASEFLSSSTSNYTLDFELDDSDNRGDYIYFGSPDMFSGINFDFATLGVDSSADLNWQYWDGDEWADLESVSGFTDGTSNFTANGAVYWSSDPTDWAPYSYSKPTELYYVRAHLESGSYSTDPIESTIKTDILNLQIYTDISANDQTIFIPGWGSMSDPVAYWAFDEGFGSTAYDTSGFENNGTITDATWQVEDLCLSGKCLNYDGDGDFVSASDAHELDIGDNYSYTVEAWVRHPEISTSADVILAKYETTGGDGGYKLLMESDGDLTFGLDDDNSSFPAESVTSSAATYDDNQWHHVAGVYDESASDLFLYIDGVLVASNTSVTLSNSPSNNDTFYIGIDGDGASNDWDGFIDEVKIYKYARSADEIKTDALRGGSVRGVSASFGPDNSWLSDGLVGYWDLDESSDGSVQVDRSDSSGNGNDLTDTNTTASATGKYDDSGSFSSTDDTSLLISDGSQVGLDITDKITISTWIRPNTVSGVKTAVAKYSTTGTNRSYMLGANSNTVEFILSYDGTNVEIANSLAGVISADNWYHLVGVYDGSFMTIYLNGEIVQAGGQGNPVSYSDGISNGAANFTIGERSDGSFNFDGEIDDTRVYNRSLSPAEVRALYEWAPGPVAHWKLDEASGTRYDSSGNGNNLTDNNTVTSSAGKYGKAGDFEEDNNEYLYITDANQTGLDLGSQFTIEFWTNLEAQSSYDAFMGKYSGAGNRSFYLYTGTTSGGIRLRFSENGTDTTDVNSAASIISKNTWSHITIKSDGSYIRLYKDGVELTSGSFPYSFNGTLFNSTDNFFIGNGGSSASYYYDGLLDDVRIYNYARTQAQIISDMNAGHPAPGSPVGSPVGHWKFDEGYGTTAQDTSINNNDLTLSAAAWTASGKFNHAWDGNGTAYLSRTDDPDFDFTASDDLTITGWFKHSLNSSTNYMVVKAQAGTNGGYKIYMASDGDIVFAVDDDSSWGPDDFVSSTAASYDDGAWHHFAAIKDGTADMYLYIDGILIDSEGTVDATGTLVNDDPLYIGVDDNGSSNPFDGELDELKIYRLALTPSQIVADMNKSSAAVMGKVTDHDEEGFSLSDPVVSWNLNENTGTSSVNDTSGNANSGTITGSMTADDWVPVTGLPRHVNGVGGSALNFDGSDDALTIATANDADVDFNGSETFSASAWVYIKTIPGSSNQDAIITKWDETSTLRGYRLVVENDDADSTGNFQVELYDESADQAITATGANDTVNENTWYHVAFTFNGGTAGTADDLKLYTNSSLTDGNDANASFLGLEDVAADFSVADYDATDAIANNTAFTGLIDHIQIFSSELTQAQIVWLYNRGGPVGWWKLDECTGIVAYDSSGNGNNGTITEPGDGSNTSIGTCAGSSGEMWADGANGKYNASLEFDGTDDYVEITDNSLLDLEVTKDYSWSGWVYPNSFSNQGQAMWSQINNGTPYLRIMPNTTTNEYFEVTSGVSVGWESSGVIYLHSIDNVLSTSEWAHITVTYNASESQADRMKIFVNAKDVTDYNNISSWGTLANISTANTYIGFDGNLPYFDGKIDDVRIYNYALTETQIKTLYNGSAVRFGN